jgi:pimeloyl-ACP methyl ester carboxylesterase
MTQVVFVHGLPETREIWTGIRARLDEDSLALALPGFAVERPPGFIASKTGYVEWLANALRATAAPVDLVAHDWGAPLSLRALGEPGVRVRSWIVDSADMLHADYVWFRWGRMLQQAGVGERMLAQARSSGAAEPASIAGRLRSLGVPFALAQRIGAVHDEPMSQSILELFRSAIPNVAADWGAARAGVDPPAGLVLVPTADPLTNVGQSEAVAELLGARCERLPGLGRCWMAEDPAASLVVLQHFWARLPETGCGH